MAIIEVPDISIVKTVNGSKQLLSLCDQKMKKDGALHTFGVGSGVKYNGDLYVLESEDNDVLFRMTTTGQNISIRLGYEIMSSQLEMIDWGDGVLEEIGEKHVYSDGISEHEILIYRNRNNKVSSLECSHNHLTSLDVSKCTELKKLECYVNDLTALDVSKNTALTDLNCSSNQFTFLDVSKNTALKKLVCSHSRDIGSLDVSKNIALIYLDCANIGLTSLDVSKNTKLETFSCSYNNLTSLDVSKNTDLKILYIAQNVLLNSQLEVSKIAMALPNRVGKESGILNVISEEVKSWIQDICTAKNWTII